MTAPATCYDCAKPKAEVEGLDTPSYTDYATAEDFFEAVRDASREAERTRLTLMRMEAREGVRAQGYEPRVSVGGNADKMATTDSRIDYEARMAERIEDDYHLLDMACAVLYGRESGKGGVDALMGSAVADCISFRYVDARPWSEVAALMGYSRWSRNSLRDMCQQGFDAIDFFGWDNVLGGMGDAT